MKAKTVIITGAGSGLGKAMAIAFASEGYNIVLSDINESSINELLNEIMSSGGQAISHVADVSDYSQMEQLVESAVKKFGALDVIVNNAGIGPKRMLPTGDSTLDDWDRVIAVNQTGVFYGMKLALQQMMKQGSGNIINIASLAGLKASGNNISYAASKFAVVGMTKAAALEYGRKNIRINAICPGYTQSALLESMFRFKPELEEALKKMIPFKRYGKASEIADAAVWLASEKSSYITGQTITLDGGLSL